MLKEVGCHTKIWLNSNNLSSFCPVRPGCEHGTCVAPDTCTCHHGYGGRSCSVSCPSGRWGPSCGYTCPCHNGATCDPVTGTCACPPGWRGERCDKKCPRQRYGQGCEEICKCQNGECFLYWFDFGLQLDKLTLRLKVFELTIKSHKTNKTTAECQTFELVVMYELNFTTNDDEWADDFKVVWGKVF